LLLVLPLPKAGRRDTTSLADANISVYRDQFAELERDLNSGTLNADQYSQAHAGSSAACWRMSKLPPRPSLGHRARV
jgi:cytochrome c-type biogenesis protein CcmI